MDTGKANRLNQMERGLLRLFLKWSYRVQCFYEAIIERANNIVLPDEESFTCVCGAAHGSAPFEVTW